jgi:cell division initiation protein
MEMDEIEGKKFRTRLMGLDPKEVEAFLQEMHEEIGRLKAENESLKRESQAQELEIREHKEREKTIRDVLVGAQKNAEQIRTNAEREAKLIISEAEVKAEALLQEANNRLIRMGQEISEMRRNRIQFGAKMRSLLDAFRQMLDENGQDTLKSVKSDE